MTPLVLIDPQLGDYELLSERDQETVLVDLLAVRLLALPREKRPAEISRLFHLATGRRLFAESASVARERDDVRVMWG